MPTAIHDAQLDVFRGGEAGEEVRAFGLGAPELEVGIARPAQRPGSEQCTSQVRAAATRARDDPARRDRERRQPRAEDPRLVKDLDGVFVSWDVKLVPRRSIEGAALIGADLGGDPESTEQAECASGNGWIGDVEMHGDLAAPLQVDAAGRVKEAGELGEPVALAAGCDGRELVAQVLRE